jgi:hypothetical protein
MVTTEMPTKPCKYVEEFYMMSSPMHRSLIKTTHVAGALVESQILATDGWKLKNIHPRGRV